VTSRWRLSIVLSLRLSADEVGGAAFLSWYVEACFPGASVPAECYSRGYPSPRKGGFEVRAAGSGTADAEVVVKGLEVVGRKGSWRARK
jgi:hypothetical protein